MSKLRVYIASAYTLGDVGENVHKAVIAANELLERGYIPFSPILFTHLWHLITPKPYQEWLDYDMNWLEACDVVLRLSGESKGADIEEAMARKLGKPVFYSIKEIGGKR